MTIQSICSFVAGAVMLTAVAGCSSEDNGATCAASGSGSSNFGDVELDALIEAAGRFGVAATDMEQSIRDACNGIASDLSAATSDDTAEACDNAATAIDGVLAQNAQATLVVEVVPAVCQASASAVVDCVAECDASFDASATPPSCDGGQLSGECSAQCSGTCTVQGSATCNGTCSATCEGTCTATVEGSCTGTCTGQCDGTCSGGSGDGNCAGQCDGICRGQCDGSISGSCSGTCGGSCSGACRAELTGTCEGTCSGECSVQYQEPVCEGGTLDVEADAQCEAACESEASLQVECSEPVVVVSFTGTVADQAALEALVATLEEHYPAILQVAARADIVLDATADLAGNVDGAVTAAAGIGLEAADCVRQAAQVALSAFASVMITVEASVEVSGSVSGSAG